MYWPSFSTGNSARHRSLARGSMQISVHGSSFSWRYRKTHSSASCPSAKTSASTATVSPTTRLIGNRPHSSSGFTPRMTTRSGGRALIFRAYHGPLTPLVVSPIVRVAIKIGPMPLSFPNESASAFLRARDFLAQHRTDYTRAVKEFRWPELAHFNWALDYFDTYADGNESEALEIVEEDGRQCIMSFAAVSARSN